MAEPVRRAKKGVVMSHSEQVSKKDTVRATEGMEKIATNAMTEEKRPVVMVRKW